MARRLLLWFVFSLAGPAVAGGAGESFSATQPANILLAGSAIETPADGCVVGSDGEVHCDSVQKPPSDPERGAGSPDLGNRNISGKSTIEKYERRIFAPKTVAPGSKNSARPYLQGSPPTSVIIRTETIRLDPVVPETVIPNSADVTIEVTIGVRASSLFVGPGEYPPTDFAAYGVVAFPEKATGNTRARHLMVCEAYVASLPKPGELAVPRSEQMVTTWPITSTELADKARKASDQDACGIAVDNYSLPAGLGALSDATAATGERIDGQGPFLVAWSPPTEKGKSKVVALVADLSSATTEEQIREYFRRWRSNIEAEPNLWKGGWSVETLRLRIRDWLDSTGAKLAVFIKSG